MTTLNRLDSNRTGLRWAEEDSFATLPGTPTWNPLEPNKFSGFGGDIKTVARSPINPSRQLRKGVTVDLDVTGAFSNDLLQNNLQELLQGFFFADLRKKAEFAVAVVTGSTTDAYTVAAAGTDMKVSDLLFAKGFADAGNNGLKKVVATVTTTQIPVSTDLVTASGQTGVISRVGHEFASGDAQITTSGDFPALVTTIYDLRDLGVIPGEYLFVGGDDSAEKFAMAADNGWARVRSVAQNKIEFDKTQGTMVADAGTAKTIRVFCGRVLKNESTVANIKRRTYQLERTLGQPDTSVSGTQAEYLVGSVASQVVFNFPVAQKLELDMTFVGKDVEHVSQTTDVKSGTRPAIPPTGTPFNSASDVVRQKMAIMATGAATPLFAFFEDLKITLNNGITPDKAVGVLGAFEHTAKQFVVSGSVTAYFVDVTQIAAVRQNADVTLELHVVKNNQGITFDLPLLTLGDGRPDTRKDEAIKVPITFDAVSGSKIDGALDHTFLMIFWDYLPNAARP